MFYFMLGDVHLFAMRLAIAFFVLGLLYLLLYFIDKKLSKKRKK